MTPPKNKKNKKLWEKAGAGGGGGSPGGVGVLTAQLLDNREDTKNIKRNTLKYNTLQRR